MLTLLIALAAAPNCEAMQWRFVYANGPQGEAVAGDRAALIAAVRRGSPLRVGWGEAAAEGAWSVEEFAAVGFTNLIGGKDLVVQLEPALIQTNYIDAGKAELAEPTLEWRALIATDGRFEAQMRDAATGKLVRTLKQRTRVHWFTLAPDPKCDSRPIVNSAPPGARNIIVENVRHPAQPAPK